MQTRSEGAGKHLSRPAARKTPASTAPTPEEIEARDHARAAVDNGLRLHGVKTKAHFEPGIGEEHTLYVNLAFATASRDRNVVVGMLEQLGWVPDKHRLSRMSFAIETLRVFHPKTHAHLTVVVRIPVGDSMRPAEVA